MAMPELDDAGFLPAGIHGCTLAEVEQRFGVFQRTDRRCRLFERLERFFAEARSTGLIAAVVVDGSFVTGKDEPSDIDLILVLPESHDFSAGLRPFEYNVLSRRQVRKIYGFDVLLAQENRPELDEYIEFYSQVRGEPERQKGLLRVEL